MKNIYLSILLIVTIGVSSCGNEFLEETDTTRLTTQYFETAKGIKDLATSLSMVLRVNSDGEGGYGMFNYGTDEFQLGSDLTNLMWNNYDARLAPYVTAGPNGNFTTAQWLWNTLYINIESQNIVIDKIDLAFPNANDADRANVLGTALFFRGFSYFLLLQQYGGIPLKLKPSTSIERFFERASAEKCIEQVIADFQEAYNLLTNSATISPGRVTKVAAAHFLAKALLYRQSEICADFNSASKANDLTKITQLCDEVIANRALATNYSDLWDYKTWDSSNEYLPEILISAQYTAQATGVGGSRMHLWFVNVINTMAGLTRTRDTEREYARLKTTNYTYDVFNRVNDSRFWKSFRTKVLVCRPDVRPAGYTWLPVGHLVFRQVANLWIINNANDADRFRIETNTAIATNNVPQTKIKNSEGNYVDIVDPTHGTLIPNVLPRYRTVKDMPTANTYGYTPSLIWAPLSKFIDGSRNNYNDNDGCRDQIVARVGETYLIGAEALIRQGNYQQALDKYINPLRARAAYKSSENRSAYVDGGQAFGIRVPEALTTPTADGSRASVFSSSNSYYESNNIPVTTAATSLAIANPNALPSEDMAIINALGLTSEFDKMLCLILNERTRELAGEMLRWPDLSRTKMLVKRAKLYNEDVIAENAIKDFHNLRPIPQEFLDNLQNPDGSFLTAEQKKAMQNPGW